ncbi:MAG: hypothetical protein ABFS30_18285, partial [Pseudomonadota bacterium]
MRQLRGFKGRYNIPKLNFHLYRLMPLAVRLATALDLGEGRFTFDPSGRDIPLFRPNQRPEPDQWHPVSEWGLPAPIPCRLLGAAGYRLRPDGIPAGLEDELRPLVGERFRNEVRLRATLQTRLSGPVFDANIAPILALSVTEDSPKIHLLPEAVAVLVGEHSGGTPFAHQEILSGNLEDWSDSLMPTDDKDLIIDSERGRFLLLDEPDQNRHVFVPVYHYGFSGLIGAGTYNRREAVAPNGVTDIDGGAQNTDGHYLDPGPVRPVTGFSIPSNGIHQFINSKTYTPNAPADNTVAD